MADFMACIALFALFMLCFYYERKEKKRKEYEGWVYDCRQCLVGIANSFRRDCQALADEAFAKYTKTLLRKSYRNAPGYMVCSFLSDYLGAVDNLKEIYLENVTGKVKEAMPYYTFTSIPDFLIDEYSKLISDTYDAFRDFEHLMWKHISEAKAEN